MTAHHFTSILATCAAVAGITLFAPALVCGNGGCEAAAQTAETKPLKLRTFMRKPVASSATSTVRRKSGEHAKATTKRQAKQSAKQREAAPKATPEAIPAAAAQAFASSYELARVRVVTPETTGPSMLAETLPVPQPGEPATAGTDNVQVVSANEVNDIDRKADSPAAASRSDSPVAISLDALSRDLAGSTPKTEDGSWFQRMLLVFGGAFAAVVTLVKTVLG